MTHDFLLVEGINLYTNIYDTDQLSVIRGSSFLYKDAIDEIKSKFSQYLEPISTGASTGLFYLKPQSTVPIATIAAQVKTLLTSEQYAYRHLTFGVESCTTHSLATAKEQLKSQLRLQQLQTLTITPDFDATTNSLPCELEGQRLVSKRTKLKFIQGKERSISTSALERWQYGREKRQNYYQELVTSDKLKAILEDYQFASDINTLCADPNYPLNEEGKPPKFNPSIPLMYPKLAGKMAVVYIDGNQFNKRQIEFITNLTKENATHTTEVAAQRTFDQEIQQLRNRFLEQEIEHLIEEEHQYDLNSLGQKPHNQKKKILRLETLIWGGDELLFVMPAWKGMDFLQRFFSFDWTLAGIQEPLTHAAGIICCQAKTPIRIIQNLAKNLADRVKEHKNITGQNIGRTKNGWDYLILESIDYPTSDNLDDYFTIRYGKHLSSHRLPSLPAITWMKIQPTLKTILEERHLPRRQIYLILQTLHEQSVGSENRTWQELVNLTEEQILNFKSQALLSAQEQAEHRLFEVSEFQSWLIGKSTDDWPALAKHCFDLSIDNAKERAWIWLHTVELWDYLAPQVNQLEKDLTV